LHETCDRSFEGVNAFSVLIVPALLLLHQLPHQTRGHVTLTRG